MIPGNRFATTSHFAPFKELTRGVRDFLLDYEVGGVALNDGTQGLEVRQWTLQVFKEAHPITEDEFRWYFRVNNGVDGWQELFYSDIEITECALAFDNNMNTFVAYVEGGNAKYRWYDLSINDFRISSLPAGSVSPRCCVDDKRSFQQSNSDVCMGYINAGKLYVRYQRENYEIDNEFASDLGEDAYLISMGMNELLRMQFRFRGAVTVAGAVTIAAPYLADVVADLLSRSKINPQHVDVSQLWVTIKGLRVANEGNAATAIATLTPAFFFDAGSWDKKLRFPMRGGEPVAHLTFDDLLERTGNDGPLGIERVQEVELLRKVNVTMVDETAGWIPNKQTAERRSATIQAIGETSLIVPITADPDFIATVAVKRLRIPWGEPNKFKYSLGIPWSHLTPTDVITMEDRKGRVYRMRIAMNEEDYGTLTFESNSDAQWIYKLTATGVSAPPSIPTVPGQVGDTVVLIVNVPAMRDQDDELGYRIAAYGTGNGWNGGVLQMSLDGGASINQSLPVLGAASVGETVTALLPEVSSEYLSDQTLRITSKDQPESVTREDVLRYANLAAVQRTDGSWEVLQHEVSTPVDPTTFDLSGLVRGRYATEPLAVPAGAAYVKLDSSVLFVQIQRWMLGMTIHYRGVSAGQNADDVAWQSFVVEDVQSQTEWPVSRVTAVRDVSDNATVEWIGRGRMGVEIAPRNSKYFRGYRITYSDGYTAETTATTHTRASTPPSVTVTVAGINEITGLGPSSEGILI